MIYRGKSKNLIEKIRGLLLVKNASFFVFLGFVMGKKIGLWVFLCCVIYCNSIFAQKSADNNTYLFVENKGQWESNILYKIQLTYGAIFFEKDKITYHFIKAADYDRFFGHPVANTTDYAKTSDSIIHSHAYNVQFLGANMQVQVKGINASQTQSNYFLGKTKQTWGTRVKTFGEIVYTSIYPGIDLRFYTVNAKLKYDFVVSAGANLANIRLQYKGANNLIVEQNRLKITTTVDTIYEEEPYVYYAADCNTQVACNYKLTNDVLEFDFPNGYLPNKMLVIDPGIVFSSLTGSSADNWGFTATYDIEGNLYTAGLAQSVGYPITAGAYQSTYRGGYARPDFVRSDISISKFDTAGKRLIYSTYVGGRGNEQPHSIIVNNRNELFVMGRTSSDNFPVTPNAFDTTFHHKFSTTTDSSDIVVFKLDSLGQELLASTYFGGSGYDGVNVSSNFETSVSSLKYNYGDESRGEIVVDEYDNCYIATCTQSKDFPTSEGAYQTVLSGKQDACIFKLNNELSELKWSTLLGGTTINSAYSSAAYSMVVIDTTKVYITGGTNSVNFPTTPGVLNATYKGGIDGFITILTNDGKKIKASSFVGTDKYDQSYFVETDEDGAIYLLGQTRGVYPVKQAVSAASIYTNPTSGQFIQKMDSNLTQSLMSTVIGSGRGIPDIALSAFLVDKCGRIYVSGWGGQVNGTVNSSTAGLPVTNGSTTDGSDFYFMKLGPDANSLEFSTFFGATQGSGDHVDGGTSRFDKRGIIYQSVCASCGASPGDFPTTPGVVSSANRSSRCNNGVIKYNLQADVIVAEFKPSKYTICVGDSIQFVNFSTGVTDSVVYTWNILGVTSSEKNIEYKFTIPGEYRIKLNARDPALCNIEDDVFHVITVESAVKLNAGSNRTVCTGDSVQINGSGANILRWEPKEFLSDSGSRNPLVFPQSDTDFILNTLDEGCFVPDTITVKVRPKIQADFKLNSSSGCVPLTVQFDATDIPASTYSWDFGNGKTDTARAPMSTFTAPGAYKVTLTVNNAISCNFMSQDTATITVLGSLKPTIFPPDPICQGDTTPVVNVTLNVDSIQYSWTPPFGVSDADSSIVRFYPTNTQVYKLKTILNNCAAEIQITVQVKDTLYANFSARANPCSDVEFGNLTNSAKDYLWNFGDGVSSTKNSPKHLYTDTGSYTVSLVAMAGEFFCPDTMQKTIRIEELPTLLINIPNVFTPDGDGVNDLFEIQNADVNCKFESIIIYSRWGGIVYQGDAGVFWDGTFEGEKVANGVYYFVLKGDGYETPGFVTVLGN